MTKEYNETLPAGCVHVKGSSPPFQVASPPLSTFFSPHLLSSPITFRISTAWFSIHRSVFNSNSIEFNCTSPPLLALSIPLSWPRSAKVGPSTGPLTCVVVVKVSREEPLVVTQGHRRALQMWRMKKGVAWKCGAWKGWLGMRLTGMGGVCDLMQGETDLASFLPFPPQLCSCRRLAELRRTPRTLHPDKGNSN